MNHLRGNPPQQRVVQDDAELAVVLLLDTESC